MRSLGVVGMGVKTVGSMVRCGSQRSSKAVAPKTVKALMPPIRTSGEMRRTVAKNVGFVPGSIFYLSRKISKGFCLHCGIPQGGQQNSTLLIQGRIFPQVCTLITQLSATMRSRRAVQSLQSPKQSSHSSAVVHLDIKRCQHSLVQIKRHSE